MCQGITPTLAPPPQSALCGFTGWFGDEREPHGTPPLAPRQSGALRTKAPSWTQCCGNMAARGRLPRPSRAVPNLPPSWALFFRWGAQLKKQSYATEFKDKGNGCSRFSMTWQRSTESTAEPKKQNKNKHCLAWNFFFSFLSDLMALSCDLSVFMLWIFSQVVKLSECGHGSVADEKLVYPNRQTSVYLQSKNKHL